MADEAEAVERALALQKKHLLTVGLGALASLVTAAASMLFAPSSEKVRDGYTVLAQASTTQDERLRRIEMLLATVLVDAGRDPAAVTDALGRSDPTMRLILRPHPSPAPATEPETDLARDIRLMIEQQRRGQMLVGPPSPANMSVTPDAGMAPESAATVRNLIDEMAVQARQPQAALPDFDTL